MVERRDGRRAVPTLETVPRGEILGSGERVREEVRQSNPDRNWGLGICKVINIDYEEFQVTLRQLVGSSDDFERVPVPMTFPGCGNRHFFGAMPEIGDLCVVGWRPQESLRPESTRTPIILAWMLPGVWPGREWMTTAGFSEDEHDYSSEKNRRVVEGVHDRIRHKLRHMQPGNIVASSSQGSDLVLDEGVTLANRRGNELRLRDQDQAFVARSLQQFHAMSGARIYGGMVQRDAMTLSTMLVSDGQVWDGPKQSTFRHPLSDQDLPPDFSNPGGFLTPPRPIRKARQDNEQQPLGNAVTPLEPHIDPYLLLQRGGFINTEGFVVDDDGFRSDAVYGGKAIFRVSSQGKGNATLDPDANTLTEYRIEVAHTSDGRLPVTEQTDMFDAERLPPNDPDTGSPRTQIPPNAAYIEWVMGSVVGNDPYSQQGKLRYGVPLMTVVFDGGTDTPNPRVVPVRVVAQRDSGDTPTPLEEHAATLFRITPPLASGASPDTFWSVNKKGQLRAAISGPAKENSVEAALLGGLKLSVGGEFKLLLNDQIKLGASKGDRVNNIGLDLSSDTGAVRIYGGGKKKGAEAVSQRNNPVDGGESDAPSVEIEARQNARIKAEKRVVVKANEAETNASQVQVNGHKNVSIRSTEKVETSAKVIQRTAVGKATESFSGPKDNLPTSGALHEITYTPLYPGINALEVDFTMGDRKETFTLGNHRTTVIVGNLTYETYTGTYTARAGLNSISVGVADGFTADVAVGDVVLYAVAGRADINASLAFSARALAGTAVLGGSAGVVLGGPILGPDQGPIITAGTLDPLTGLPFATWGMGAKGHVVGVFT